MRFVFTNDRKSLFRYLCVDIVKHVLVRWMIRMHLIPTHVSSVISLMERIEHEVNVAMKVVTNWGRFKIICTVPCLHIQFYRTSCIVDNSQWEFANAS